MTAKSRDSSITVTFPNRKQVAAHLVTMGGDSVVVETDRYPSLTRPGHMTSVRMVSHVGKHKMRGTFRVERSKERVDVRQMDKNYSKIWLTGIEKPRSTAPPSRTSSIPCSLGFSSSAMTLTTSRFGSTSQTSGNRASR